MGSYKPNKRKASAAATTTSGLGTPRPLKHAVILTPPKADLENIYHDIGESGRLDLWDSSWYPGMERAENIKKSPRQYAFEGLGRTVPVRSAENDVEGDVEGWELVKKEK
jgi:hypothetical protein